MNKAILLQQQASKTAQKLEMEHKSNRLNENTVLEEEEKKQESKRPEANGKLSQSKQELVDGF